MTFYLSLPLIFLKFWFYEAPIGILLFFNSLNKAFLNLFSLPLFLKTFFKPLKNEYREGLVVFSIGMGMFVKTLFILFDLFLFSILLILELAMLAVFILLPVNAFVLLLL